MNKFFKHLNTVNSHRRTVFKICCKFGIPVQGLLHDLSKYSWTEFSIYKYYVGTKSPHQIARETIGYSPSWIHHKGHNKHHWEYWVDDSDNGDKIPIKVPFKYVLEMVADCVAASKTYLGDKYTDDAPYEYWKSHEQHRLYHEDTRKTLNTFFIKIKCDGLDSINKYFINSIKNDYERKS